MRSHFSAFALSGVSQYLFPIERTDLRRNWLRRDFAYPATTAEPIRLDIRPAPTPLSQERTLSPSIGKTAVRVRASNDWQELSAGLCCVGHRRLQADKASIRRTSANSQIRRFATAADSTSGGKRPFAAGAKGDVAFFVSSHWLGVIFQLIVVVRFTWSIVL